MRCKFPSFSVSLAIAASLSFLFAVSSPAAPVIPIQDTDALVFLKQSMDRYKSLDALTMEGKWSASFGPGAETTSTRNISYAKPNRWKVVSTIANGFTLVSVSDGKKVAEYSNQLNNAMTYAAPEKLSAVTTMEMKHPMFCGTPLYAFFGGSENIAALVDTTKGPVRFGDDVTLDGHACKTVKFFARDLFGTTEIAIATDDFLVRRIRYNSEPLITEAKKSNPGLSNGFVTTESYQQIVVNPIIADTVFDTKLPDGKQNTEAGAADNKPPVPLGQTAPDFEVSALTGTITKLSSFRGKVVLIDFWATWCPPCRKGLPETQKFYNRFAGKGLVVMAISDEAKSTVKPFLTKEKYTFPTYLDTSGAANKSYKIEAIPTVAIIDRTGKLSAFMVGLQTPETILAALHKAGFSGN